MILNKKILIISLLAALICLCSISLISAVDDTNITTDNYIIENDNLIMENNEINSYFYTYEYKKLNIPTKNKLYIKYYEKLPILKNNSINKNIFKISNPEITVNTNIVNAKVVAMKEMDNGIDDLKLTTTTVSKVPYAKTTTLKYATSISNTDDDIKTVETTTFKKKTDMQINQVEAINSNAYFSTVKVYELTSIKDNIMAINTQITAAKSVFNEMKNTQINTKSPKQLTKIQNNTSSSKQLTKTTKIQQTSNNEYSDIENKIKLTSKDTTEFTYQFSYNFAYSYSIIYYNEIIEDMDSSILPETKDEFARNFANEFAKDFTNNFEDLFANEITYNIVKNNNNPNIVLDDSDYSTRNSASKRINNNIIQEIAEFAKEYAIEYMEMYNYNLVDKFANSFADDVANNYINEFTSQLIGSSSSITKNKIKLTSEYATGTAYEIAFNFACTYSDIHYNKITKYMNTSTLLETQDDFTINFANDFAINFANYFEKLFAAKITTEIIIDGNDDSNIIFYELDSINTNSIIKKENNNIDKIIQKISDFAKGYAINYMQMYNSDLADEFANNFVDEFTNKFIDDFTSQYC